VRPPAFEVYGEVVARPAPDLLLVRHGPATALGMPAMEMMAVDSEPTQLDAAALRPGDRVRLAVRPQGDRLVLLSVRKVP
jgi:Cu/Ag efflux protein CusF